MIGWLINEITGCPNLRKCVWIYDSLRYHFSMRSNCPENFWLVILEIICGSRKNMNGVIILWKSDENLPKVWANSKIEIMTLNSTVVTYRNNSRHSWCVFYVDFINYRNLKTQNLTKRRMSLQQRIQPAIDEKEE